MLGTGAAVAVPETFNVTVGLFGSFDGTSRLSLETPGAVGANLTLKVQLAAGGTVWFEQLSFTTLNGAASASAEATAPTARPALPLLVTVTVLSSVVFSVMLPKGMSRSPVGATESVTEMLGTGAAVAVPETFNVTVGLFGSFDGTSRLSLETPGAVGANLTLKVQLAAGGTVWFEQLSFTTLNGAASASAEATAPTARPALPLLVTVTVLSSVVFSVMLPKGMSRSPVGATESVTVMLGASAAPVPVS